MARHGGTVNKDRTIEPRARHSGTVNRTIEPQVLHSLNEGKSQVKKVARSGSAAQPSGDSAIAMKPVKTKAASQERADLRGNSM